ncbi:signal peptidase I [Pullulanibacillus camelliae]|nr:signal peptidase I [Pullulanibacillus camelliae]
MSQKKRKSWGMITPLILAIILAFVIRIFVFEQIMVEGASMQPTLHSHEYALVNKLIYRIKKPQRFDVVVFHAEANANYIKRVIGLPGETIEYKQDVLYVNGKKVDEPFSNKDVTLTGLSTYNFKTKVPKGTVFVLGDNRRESHDSRNLGPIPIAQIVGRTDFVFWPLKDIKSLI